MNLSLNYIVAVVIIAISIYCLLYKRNLLKIIIALSLMTDGVHLFLISLGYKAGGIAPIIAPGVVGAGSGAELAVSAVDPLPQALVLTSIVINVAILALALSLAVHLHRHYGTLDISEARRLRE